MAKKQTYVGLETEKDGNGLRVNCGLVFSERSRKAAEVHLREHEMKPMVLLTEKEANQMLDTLLALLRPGEFTKKKERELIRMTKK